MAHKLYFRHDEDGVPIIIVICDTAEERDELMEQAARFGPWITIAVSPFTFQVGPATDV